jgi:GTP 3',8-cyclase
MDYGEPMTTGREAPGQLVDQYGRVARDLRVSLTDRCNLRCSYCMPVEGLAWLPKPELLTDEELIRVVSVGIELLGVRSVRLTGGEPLLRPGLPGIVRAIRDVNSDVSISLTTNGIGLASMADALAAAGLNRINVSLDTLVRQRFIELAKRDRLEDVLTGLAAAANSGLAPVKVNAVLLRGVNDDEAGDLLRFCLERGYELRFIEQMPLDPMHGWSRDSMVTAAETKKLLDGEFDLTPDDAHRGSAPAQLWRVNGGAHRVGIIASVTQPFCAACDRTRLTADGQLRNCLFARQESDLRTTLRAGANDAELAQQWIEATWSKAAGHGIDDPSFLQPTRPMSAIGG